MSEIEYRNSFSKMCDDKIVQPFKITMDKR